ncbi:Sugar transport protein 13 [Turnera subulata]|uniref:Sugar transport protein 13 n=1 Tax=Turnera subulata TaxID=218843 RepID=A0A9Q0GE40_9ROSI|nr:Sugar transport protein 13 [Turnera subulata]
MAGGGFATAGPGGGVEFEARITPIVIISCIMAATGGLMFGYDVGVSGGVTSMPDFLEKFFPVVYKRTNDPRINSNYCKYDNQGLQLFTSSLYLAGLTATFFASYTTRQLGRRPTMLIAGLFFIGGVVLNAAAQDLAMLIIGRILLGCGVGFANQESPRVNIRRDATPKNGENRMEIRHHGLRHAWSLRIPAGHVGRFDRYLAHWAH